MEKCNLFIGKTISMVQATVVWCLFSVILVLLIIKGTPRKQTPKKPIQTTAAPVLLKTKKEVKKHDKVQVLTRYFRKIGSPAPHAMAKACLATNRPRILAAMAKKETRGDHTKRGTGFRGVHCGAWQVNPNYWGPVSHDPVKQAKQVEKIINQYLKESDGHLRIALNKFGGDTRGLYYQSVANNLREVPQI